MKLTIIGKRNLFLFSRGGGASAPLAHACGRPCADREFGWEISCELSLVGKIGQTEHYSLKWTANDGRIEMMFLTRGGCLQLKLEGASRAST